MPFSHDYRSEKNAIDWIKRSPCSRGRRLFKVEFDIKFSGLESIEYKATLYPSQVKGSIFSSDNVTKGMLSVKMATNQCFKLVQCLVLSEFRLFHKVSFH